MSSTLEAAHTPGPWMFGAGFGAHGMRVDALGGAKSICGVLHVWRDVHEPDGRKVGSQRIEEGWANLQLIAAAPELLQALTRIIQADDAHALTQEHIEFARAAAAKALGAAA